MKAYVLLAIILASLLVGAGGAWKVQDWRYAAKERDRIEQEAKEQAIRLQRVDKAAVGHEADKSQIRTQFVTVTETVEKIVEKPIYRDMCLDDDGLRAIGAAIHGPATGSEPKGAVSGADGASGRKQGNNAPVGR